MFLSSVRTDVIDLKAAGCLRVLVACWAGGFDWSAQAATLAWLASYAPACLIRERRVYGV